MQTARRCVARIFALAGLCVILTGAAGAGELPSDVAATVAGNNRFALDLYAKLAVSFPDEKNTFISPYSISSALAMTYAGARGQTAEEMAVALHFDLPPERFHPAMGEIVTGLNAQGGGNYELAVANRLWGRQGYVVKQPFLETTRNDYGAEMAVVDFVGDTEGARTTINDWVADQTNDRIPNLLPEGSVTRDTAMVLTNAVYFKGDWKYAFKERSTFVRPFHLTADRDITTSMMHQTKGFRYADLPDRQILELPYEGDDLSMLVVLPKEIDGLADVTASLDLETLESHIAAMRFADVNVSLPKFELTDSIDLGGTLSEMGMPTAFRRGAADFSGIGEGALSISAVIHKTFVSVNESGTEAAGATGVGFTVTTTAYPPPPKVFRADHPFLYLIRDNHSGSILFMGQLDEPEEVEMPVPDPSDKPVPDPPGEIDLPYPLVGILIPQPGASPAVPEPNSFLLLLSSIAAASFVRIGRRNGRCRRQ